MNLKVKLKFLLKVSVIVDSLNKHIHTSMFGVKFVLLFYSGAKEKLQICKSGLSLMTGICETVDTDISEDPFVVVVCAHFWDALKMSWYCCTHFLYYILM